MKESIYTMPLIDAFRSSDECPFCFIERELEHHAVSFILGSGSSYMEDDIRMETDRLGFCRHHYKMMFDYGNRLGTALMLSTHFHKLNQELEKQIHDFSHSKPSFLQKLKKSSPDPSQPGTNIGAWVTEKESQCYICDHIHQNYPRYLSTFFELYLHNEEFVSLFQNSKGFCLPHFRDLTEEAQIRLKGKEQSAFYTTLFSLMQTNFKRLEEEVTWFVDKCDYLNRDKDWGNSKDSIQRCMQKAAGGYPADSVFTE